MLVDDNVNAGYAALEIIAKSKHGKNIIDNLIFLQHEKIDKILKKISLLTFV
jgi:hypothetical protein